MTEKTFSVLHYAVSFLAGVFMKEIQPPQVRYTDVLVPILMSHVIDFVIGIPSLRKWHDNMGVWLLFLFFSSALVLRFWHDHRGACMLSSVAIGSLVHAGCDDIVSLVNIPASSWALFGL